MTLREIMPRWKALRPALGLARRLFPLTRAGASLAAMDGFALWAEGLRHQNLVVLAASALVLFIQCGLVLMVSLAAGVLRFFPRQGPTAENLELETTPRGAQAQATGFALSFPAWLPFVSLSWDWLQPAGVQVEVRREGGKLCEYILAPHRLACDAIVREFRCGDFLGLAEVSWLVEQKRSVRILPAPAAAAALALRAGLAQGSEWEDPTGAPLGSLTEMREYRPGDSPRLIRWKLFAHSRKLIVRTPEPALEENPNACAWLAGGKSSEAAARLLREALEKGMLGEHWGLGASGSHTIVLGEMERARDRIAGSGNAPELDTGEVLRFLAEAELAGFTACYMFLSTDGANLPAKMKQISRLAPIDLHAVFVVPAIDPSPLPSGALRRLFCKPRPQPHDHSSVAAAVGRLSSFFQTSLLCDLAGGALV